MKDNNTRRKPEIRTVACQLKVRETSGEDGTREDSRVITGTAIVFNVPFDVEGWDGTTYREIIDPSAVTMEFLKTQDIKMNLLHKRDATLARWNKGEGNMDLSVDKEGVHFEFEAPRCDLGDRALELVKAGVYSGCSFEFYAKDYETSVEDTENGRDLVTIRHKAFESIEALTIAMDPAYEQTSVSARELRENAKGEHAKSDRERERAVAVMRAQQQARARQMRNNEIF